MALGKKGLRPFEFDRPEKEKEQNRFYTMGDGRVLIVSLKLPKNAYAMNETAVFLVLLSAVMHALRNFLTKKALDKQAFVWWYEIFGLIFFTPVFVWALGSGHRQDCGHSVILRAPA